MARKPRDPNEQNEAGAGVYESIPPFPSRVEMIDSSAELINASPLMPSAVDRDGASAADVASPPRYRVLTTQYVMTKGGRTLIRAGKIVDANNFDLPSLASQGVQLEAVE